MFGIRTRLALTFTAVGLIVTTGTLAAPVAYADTGPGTAIDIVFGEIDNDGALTFSGTVSCANDERSQLVVNASELGLSAVTGTLFIPIACPVTGQHVEGAVTPVFGPWSSTAEVAWHAELIPAGELNGVAVEQGDVNMTTGENDSVAADTAKLNGEEITVDGSYECNGTADRKIAVTLAEVSAPAQTIGSAQITVACPTHGQRTYQVNITPWGHPTTIPISTIVIHSSYSGSTLANDMALLPVS